MTAFFVTCEVVTCWCLMKHIRLYDTSGLPYNVLVEITTLNLGDWLDAYQVCRKCSHR